MVTAVATTFGQLGIEPVDDGFVVSGPDGDGPAIELQCSPEHVSEHHRSDDTGRYRPLSGARSMRSGWKVRATNQRELDTIIDAVYPLARVHRSQNQARALRIVPLQAVLAGQSGRYSSANNLSAAGRELATSTLCGDCVRTPVWRGDQTTIDDIPCPEACSVLVSLCREAAIWEQSRPRRATIDESVGYADFGIPGNALRETVLAAMNTQRRP